MSKKHVPVTDMTFGQLYLVSNHLRQERVIEELEKGNITRQVEIPWTDQLDSTWENGVWCMCDRAPNLVNVGFVKVIPESILDHLFNHWENAKTLDEEAATTLEKLSKK